MQFLLLLSALLSAVTGAFAGPRAVEAPVSQSEAQLPSTEQAATVAQAPARLPPSRGLAVQETRSSTLASVAYPAAPALADVRLNE